MTSRDTAHSPRRNTSCLYIAFSCFSALGIQLVAAGRSPEDSLSTTIPLDVLMSGSRQLSQEGTDWTFDASADSMWEGIEPCPELVELLTRTPQNSRLGNFTEIPDPAAMRECFRSYGLMLLDGDALADALAEPTPLLKTVILGRSEPVVWPKGTEALHLAPGSVNMIDCQDGCIDLRNRNFDVGMENATLLYSRCTVVLPDVSGLWTQISYLYDGASIYPCNGTSKMSEGFDYPRSDPGYFEELTGNLGPNATVHFRNYSLWCYTEDDILDLYGPAAAVHGTTVDDSQSHGSDPWIPWLIAVCAVVVLGCMLVALFVCWGSCERLCGCPHYRHRSNSALHSKHLNPDRSSNSCATADLQSQDHVIGSDDAREQSPQRIAIAPNAKTSFLTAAAAADSAQHQGSSSFQQQNSLQASSVPRHSSSIGADHASTTVDTFDLLHTATELMAPPDSDAPVEAHLDFLHQQLDCIGVERPVLDGLLLMGSGGHRRLQGGQAVVQMARGKHDGMEYAIKFFVSRAAFDAESDLYSQRASAYATGMAKLLPQVRNVEDNEDKSFTDTQGHPLPPCIVMERGESLDIWAERAKPDRSQAFTMVHHLAIRLKDFHALGFVHRDLKPGNVMWLPRENRWTIIDFGCVARTGESARLGFSLAYTAPEVVSAYRAGEHFMVAKEAVDVWSLGVIAFELLVGHPALRMHEGKEKVMDRIEGRNGSQLPWEDACMSASNRRKLGVFRNSLTALLSRDPSQRPSMEQFCETCDRVLGASTTVQV